MRYILLLLIIVPALEIGLLVLSGQAFGLIPTVLLIITTGILGAYLAKKQGMEALRKAQQDMQYGQLPGDAIIDGLCILVGGVVLLTPGFITDAIGFLLLLPPTRKMFKPFIYKLFKRWINNGNVIIYR
ncbi:MULTISPECIES: FxsA family protein [Rossellomorea]|uniref:Membrane protein FxsA n=1 Tax=Rossellomorea aquimaris TaxID=189382 RepID=A0A5D4TUK0_9BACI|nr:MULTISPECIES: FxsA family protein [Rossellomorea]MDT9025235.1 FxsA family protein [Rossellomorea sp. YC4-1]TYS77904.1 membrane protein FxsA [Rossellomorea aquimaris]TYS87087.1 membrane protein FxsA [Rossellomorea aquimaris]